MTNILFRCGLRFLCFREHETRKWAGRVNTHLISSRSDRLLYFFSITRFWGKGHKFPTCHVSLFSQLFFMRLPELAYCRFPTLAKHDWRGPFFGLNTEGTRFLRVRRLNTHLRVEIHTLTTSPSDYTYVDQEKELALMSFLIEWMGSRVELETAPSLSGPSPSQVGKSFRCAHR